MTNLLSGRHKYLTYKNTKKGQKVLQKAFATRKAALSALKNGYCAFAAGESCSTSCREPFFEMISFFLHSVSAKPHGCEKASKREKNPRNLTISGVQSHDIFFGFAICVKAIKKIFFVFCIKVSNSLIKPQNIINVKCVLSKYMSLGNNSMFKGVQCFGM